MTSTQLKKIKEFAKGYYQKNDQFHQWDHALLTVKYALILAKQYNNVNLKFLEAACYLHDIGRVNKDDGHPEESARLATPFLRKIGIKPDEIRPIVHAIEIHAKERIKEAKTLEARILFDADKLQILSVYGFIRVYSFLIVERQWEMERALSFMREYVQSVYKNYLQTPLAKKKLAPEMKEVEKIVGHFRKGISGKL